MPRRRRSSEPIGTAGFSIIDTPTDASLENHEPDTTTGGVPEQDDDLEKGTRVKRRTGKSGSTTNRK